MEFKKYKLFSINSEEICNHCRAAFFGLLLRALCIPNIYQPKPLIYGELDLNDYVSK